MEGTWRGLGGHVEGAYWVCREVMLGTWRGQGRYVKGT